MSTQNNIKNNVISNSQNPNSQSLSFQKEQNINLSEQKGTILNNFQKNPRTSIAYFSMEIAISHLVPSYHGGLGILAGDILKSGADLGLNVAGIGLFCQYGNFKQSLDKFGNQKDELSAWNPHDFYELLPQTFEVSIGGENILGRIWRYNLNGVNGKTNPIYFIDASDKSNSSENQKISYQLYSGNPDIWLRQQIFLGIGGVKALLAMGLPLFDTYHLNESHDLFVMLELRKILGSWEKVKERTSFTIHTPLPGAHATLEFEQLKNYLTSQEVELLQEAVEIEI